MGCKIGYAAVLLTLLSVLLQCIGANELARGWGDNIKWMTLEDGLKKSAETSQPLMLVIHKSWCGACRSLKPKFADSKEIEELSEKLVMVNVQDDEEPTDAKYAPDGGYIPRIFFLDSRGEVHKEIFNKGGNENYKYYYHEANSIVRSMNEALEVVKAVPKEPTDEL